MYTISKRFSFSASHQLEHLPDGHKCKRLHGHNYEVELVLCSPSVDHRGFVVDYGDLKPFGGYIAEHLDHRHLNDVLSMPTAELLARHLYDIAHGFWPERTIAVRVSETPKTWASYTVEVP